MHALGSGDVPGHASIRQLAAFRCSGAGAAAMAWLVWKSGSRKVYVGAKYHALDWAKQHEAAIVNCADVDYDWEPKCDRRWLNVNCKGTLNGRTWIDRAHRRLLEVRVLGIGAGRAGVVPLQVWQTPQRSNQCNGHRVAGGHPVHRGFEAILH